MKWTSKNISEGFYDQTIHVASVSSIKPQGRLEGNRDRICEAIDVCKSKGVQLILSRNVPFWIFIGRSFADGRNIASFSSLDEILPHTANVLRFLVFFALRCDLYVRLSGRSKLGGLVPKENLATGDGQYENRWFAGWPHTRVEEYRLMSGEDIPFGGLIFSMQGFGVLQVEMAGWGFVPVLLCVGWSTHLM